MPHERELSPNEAEAVVRKEAERVDERDLDTVLAHADELERKLQSGPFRRIYHNAQSMLSLLWDYYKGRYRKVPWWTVAAVTGTLLYLLNPLDLIPDFIPGLGAVDDLAVFWACMRLVEKDLVRYRAWQHLRDAQPEAGGDG